MKTPLVVLLLVGIVSAQTLAASPRKPVIQLTGGGSLPLTQTTGPSDGGLGASLTFGLQAIPSAPELLFAVRGSYTRFPSSTPERSVRSVMTGGAEIMFSPDQDKDQKWFLLIGAGIAHADKMFTTINDPYGCAGAGAEIGPPNKPHLIVELRLTDISNNVYGDFRYLTLSAGIRF